MISKYYGIEETNQGMGYKFELIRDYDNNISKEVDKYLDNPFSNQEDIQEILKLLPQLKEYLFSEKIYVKDLHPVNVIFQKQSENTGRLVIIDGLAHNNLNFLFKIDAYLLYKLKKKWNKFVSIITSKID